MAASSTSPASQSGSESSSGPKGAFHRTEAQFRSALGSDEFPIEAGRYHLYVSYACPWACRCLMARKLKGLERFVSVSVVDPVWDYTRPGEDEHRGWQLTTDFAGSTGDPHFGARTIRELYDKLGGGVSVRTYSVPLLVDVKASRIVNNESSEIIRQFDELNDVAEHPEVRLYPEALRSGIDAVNAWVYPKFNNGVYRAGFAKTQEAYDEAVDEVFEALDRMEGILAKQRFLVGNEFTEADLRAFVTLVRFDAVYVTHFKCARRTIREYPHLTGFMREIYQMPGMAETVNLEHIRHHYQRSHPTINPYGIVAVTADPKLDEPHGRDSISTA